MAGFVAFLTAYQVYAFFLAHIDGLPPLPESYFPRADDSPIGPITPVHNRVDQLLQLAFGGDEKIMACPIKLDVRSRGLVVASEQFVVEEDGTVRLTPCNLAIFGKDHAKDTIPEINTVRSREAYLTFDRPVSNITEIGSRKIVACKLVNDVQFVNNRRTLQRDDDLCIITPGPVYYQESLNRIWTNSWVDLKDLQSKPDPTTTHGTGMDLYLATDSAPVQGQPGRKRARSDKVSGVERVVLRSDVEMHLYSDSSSGFMNSGKTPPAPKPGEKSKPVETPKKAHIVIKTLGPFRYDATKDFAEFDISSKPSPYFPNRVTVTRQIDPSKLDELDCDRLELQFHKKDAKAAADTPKPAPGDQSVDLEIETAHAVTLVAGSQVTLKSDEEELVAFGHELVYDARTRQTVLRGRPDMVAMKAGNEIYARELVMISSDKTAPAAKDSQQATAKGPGRLAMLDKSSGQRTLHARWKDELLFGKDGPFDLLTLNGDAAFEDKEHGQQLAADRLKVWLQPSEKTTTGESQKRAPDHIEANGNVNAVSPDMRIHDTEHLIIRFKDAKPVAVALATPAVDAPTQLPDAGPAKALPPAAPMPSAAPTATPPPTALPPANPPTAAASDKDKDKDKGKPKKPIDLRARSVQATVLRTGEKNDLDKLWCEGNVDVHQEPANEDDKGVDIRGQTLQLTKQTEGNILVVTGDLAYVQLNKIAIIGPEVNIDQVANKAWVNGIGSMKMPTTTTLEGQKLEQPKELTVHWNKAMFFNGKCAEFHGGVQTEQDAARLACQEMQVYLDRIVSLREGEKGEKPAKIEKLVCDRKVRVEEPKFAENRLVGYQRIVAPELSVDNEDGHVIAPGPGVVHILQLGNKGDTFATPGSQPTNPRRPASEPTPSRLPGSQKSDEELKLTRVAFSGRMFANNNTRTAVFYDNVEVVNLPADDPDVTIDLDRLPKGAMHMRCEQMKVYSRKLPDGKTMQEMEAYKRVIVQAQEFWGRADLVKYDESKELVIFEGVDGNKATLYRVKARGTAPEEIRGKKIYYWRRTNDFKVDDGTGINVTNN
jgi:hypothetical protein